MPWHATAVTLFPEMFPGPLAHSLAGRGLLAGLWRIDTVDMRSMATDRHRSVDGTPAGGGPGMVLRADIVAAALDSIESCPPRPRILLTPRGVPLTQGRVRDLSAGPGVVLVCGRFEGVDERLVAARGLEEIAVGDFILSGGEPAALMLLDACVRLVPGIMGDAQSGVSESFAGNLIEYPQFTRPAEFEGVAIPDVLVAGDHGRVAAWRRAQAMQITRSRRPDLWERFVRGLGRRDPEDG